MVFALAYVAGGLIAEGGSGSFSTTYGAKIKISAETVSNTSKAWAKEDAVIVPREDPPKRHIEEKKEIVKFSMNGYLCRVQEKRIYCYSLGARRCVVLRKGRGEKPDELEAVAGGAAIGVCRGLEMYEEQ